MMNKRAINSLRLIGMPLLLGIVLSWGTTLAYSATIAPESKAALSKAEARERQNYSMELDGQRKQVDWWLTLLGILAAIMAIAGGLIPYMMARKDKEIIKQDMKVIEQDKAQVRAWLDEIEKLKHKASADTEAIQLKLKIVSGTPSATSEDVQQTAKRTAQDETADPLLRLRAKAVEASLPENAHGAYTLWATLTELDVQDANAMFNAGYWAHELSVKAQGIEKLIWLRTAGNSFAQALSLKPDMHEAAYNWGISLDAEAGALAATEPDAARALWKQAGEKYQQVLAIKPSKYVAAINWGMALADEARAFAVDDLAAARVLWKLAGEKFQLALGIKPDLYEAAINWGNALADEASALAATNLGDACALWEQAGKKSQLALNIKPDSYAAAGNWVNALLNEAGAIASSDQKRFGKLLDQAERLMVAHADKEPSEVAYNLACIYGARADVQSCLKWLRISQEHGALPDCENLRANNFLDAVRDTPEYIEWFKQACQ